MAELMLGQPLFPGESGIDQLVEIIKVLGTPSREQIKTMNPNYMEHKFPQIKPHPFSKVGFYGAILRLRANTDIHLRFSGLVRLQRPSISSRNYLSTPLRRV